MPTPPPTRWAVSDAAGAAAAISQLAAAPAARPPKAVLFTATPDPATGTPWCPDCARTLAGVRSAVAAADGTLLEVEVARPEWKDPANPSPLRAAYGLAGIPALAVLGPGGGVDRVLGTELEEAPDAAAAEAVVARWLKGGGWL